MVSLFDYATSELSQDAFLCWLVANAGQATHPPLRQLGCAFIAWLWTVARGERVDPNSVRLLAPPRRQVHHVDITFDAEVGGRVTTFLIEDKTETSQHSGQLERYKAAFGADGRDLVPVYFKTGYHFAIDAAAASHGYGVVGLEQWVAFLDEHLIANDIVADYHAAMTRILRARQENLAALSTATGHANLGVDYVQCDFVKRLAARCTRTVDNGAIHRGVNVGGTPWTHYRFARFAGVLPGGVDESLFHRVDARNDAGKKRRFYLSTRQYAAVKSNPVARAAKLERLAKYVDAFQHAVRAGGTGLTFSTPSTDRRGANESEIGILFFDESVNTIPAVLDAFAAVHAAFVQRLGA